MISIIVPIFNMEKYLSKALSSIAKQEMKNFEVILIDDGSTDSSKQICQHYVKMDSRFHYYFQKTQGVSGARNLGLDNAKGELIAFVDPDDTIEPQYLAKLSAGFKSKIDLVAAGYTICSSGKKSKEYHVENEKQISAKEARKLLFTDNSFYSFLWNKIFKKSIIIKNALRFDKALDYGEDLLFCDDYLKYAENVALIADSGYCYWRHADSVGGALTKEKILKRITYIDAMVKIENSYTFDISSETGIKRHIGNKIALNGSFYLVQMEQLKSDKKAIHDLKSKIKPYVKSAILGKTTFKNKLKLFFFFYCTRFSRRIV